MENIRPDLSGHLAAAPPKIIISSFEPQVQLPHSQMNNHIGSRNDRNHNSWNNPVNSNNR